MARFATTISENPDEPTMEVDVTTKKKTTAYNEDAPENGNPEPTMPVDAPSSEEAKEEGGFKPFEPMKEEAKEEEKVDESKLSEATKAEMEAGRKHAQKSQTQGVDEAEAGEKAASKY